MVNLQRPLQAIFIEPDEEVRNNILAGRQTAIVREGHRDYQNGPVILCCHRDNWVVMAEVIRVVHCDLVNVPTADLPRAGFKSRLGLRQYLEKIYYRPMKWLSPITVIIWKDVQGKLAREARH